MGEFEVDEATPFYLTDAPETGGGPIRQVIVFRLLPIGDVVQHTQDAFQTPEGVSPAAVEAAVAQATETIAVEADVEQLHTEIMVVAPNHQPHEAERREQKLVIAYKKHLERRGSVVKRLRIQPPGEAKPLYNDLIDRTRNDLVEGKGTGTRQAVRVAIGQFADYSRFAENSPARGVLLPARPRLDLEALLRSEGISCIWPDGGTFHDNADGRFT